MIYVIHKKDFQKSLWKNGQGVTYQISIYPTNCSVIKNDFIWRLSQAEVKSDNSFSSFPECERKLTVVSGVGLNLNQTALRQNQVHTFSGEEPIDCTLIDHESVLDLGLIYKKNLVQAEFKFVNVDDTHTVNLSGRTDFLYLLNGETCHIENELLTQRNIIQIENEAFVQLKNPSQTPLRLIHIEIKY